MGFTCINEIEISGLAEEDRRAAAKLLLAADYANDAAASLQDSQRAAAEPSLVLRFESADGLPEEEIATVAAQFPGLSIALAYFSLDGEFYGYARAGSSGVGAESEDFEEDTREVVGRRYDGNAIAFVKARFGLSA
jgi:hypothetical protein